MSSTNIECLAEQQRIIDAQHDNLEQYREYARELEVRIEDLEAIVTKLETTVDDLQAEVRWLNNVLEEQP